MCQPLVEADGKRVLGGLHHRYGLAADLAEFGPVHVRMGDARHMFDLAGQGQRLVAPILRPCGVAQRELGKRTDAGSAHARIVSAILHGLMPVPFEFVARHASLSMIDRLRKLSLGAMVRTGGVVELHHEIGIAAAQSDVGQLLEQFSRALCRATGMSDQPATPEHWKRLG